MGAGLRGATGRRDIFSARRGEPGVRVGELQQCQNDSQLEAGNPRVTA